MYVALRGKWKASVLRDMAKVTCSLPSSRGPNTIDFFLIHTNVDWVTPWVRGLHRVIQ